MLFPALMYFVTLSSSVSDVGPGSIQSLISRVLGDTTQTASDDTTQSLARLTVRPKEMATGTETRQVGLTPLDGLSGYYVYVPPQCVGKKRSPLVVLLHGGGHTGLQEMTKFQGLADKYGMIVLAPTSVRRGQWSWIGKYPKGDSAVLSYPGRDLRNIDIALTQVLRTYAIDPGRIALTGFSDGGSYSLFLGRSNLDIFSRIAPLSVMWPTESIGPSNPSTQFFMSMGFGEPKWPKRIKRMLEIAHQLRQRGHTVMTQIGLRAHSDYLEDEDFIWAWLEQSWADPATSPRVLTETDTDPELTEDALRKMIAFWIRFQQAPDSIRMRARMQHQVQLPLTISSERTTVILMNLPALAVAYPSIAAMLDSVELTAAQAMEYRIAIIRAGIARDVGMTTMVTSGDSFQTGALFARISPTSVLGRNLEFWKIHEAMFTELEKTKMWVTQ